MLGLAINELFVNLIGEDHDVLTQSDFTESQKFFLGVNGTRWVAWCVNDDHLGRRSHRFLELLGGHFPSGRFLGFNDHWDTSRETDHLWVGNPKW